MGDPAARQRSTTAPRKSLSISHLTHDSVKRVVRPRGIASSGRSAKSVPAAAGDCARAVAPVLGWDEARITAEAENYRAYVKRMHLARAEER